MKHYITSRNRRETGFTLEDLWGNMNKVWKELAESIVGKKQRSNKPWISQKTLEKLEERRKAKARINQAQTRQQKKTSSTHVCISTQASQSRST